MKENKNTKQNLQSISEIKTVRIIPLLILLACLIVLILIPLKIISYGYLPSDDALRHSGFSTVDKTWNDVLVSDYAIPDMHIGWHQTLKYIHKTTNATADELVTFSVVLLFLLWVIPSLFMLKRPESWIFALLLAYWLAGLNMRLFLGRPGIFHGAVLVWMLLLADRLNEKKNNWGIYFFLTFTTALSIYWRTTWFMYALPVLAFVLARRWRATVRLLGILTVAMGLATLATGPTLMINSLVLSFKVMGSAEYVTQLVGELQPMTSFMSILLTLSLFSIWIHLRGDQLRRFFDTPSFYLLIISAFLGVSAIKWWLDFGVPSFVVLICLEMDSSLSETPFFTRVLSPISLRRLGIVLATCTMLFLCFTVDERGRWTAALHNEEIDITDKNVQPGLPEDGGIIYNDSMGTFFQTFFNHPDQNWHYILGFEAALMPKEDLQIFRNIQWNSGALKAYDPWIQKMTKKDRLWIAQGLGAPHPRIKSLEWTRLTSFLWSGRLPQTNSIQKQLIKKNSPPSHNTSIKNTPYTQWK